MKITVDTRANTLRFDFAPSRRIAQKQSAPAVLDVGEGGRLLGLDVDYPGIALPPGDEPAAIPDPATGSLYVALDERLDRHSRSAEVTAELALDAGGRLATITIPRRGAGYEITYPSGNR